MRNVLLAIGVVLFASAQIVAAELNLPRHGTPVHESSSLDRFGRYGDAYYLRRWKRMCAGSARYDAMREANDLGKPNPC